MSTTPEFLRDQAQALLDEADRLEQVRPLPTVPGWYPTIVVERGGESCTGALLADDDGWRTAREVDGCYGHWIESNPDITIRWAEQDGKTPGQTLWEAEDSRMEWCSANPDAHARAEHVANAVLAAHGTPTLTDDDRSEVYRRGWLAGNDLGWLNTPTLTPVGESPEPGTRGLLPVVLDVDGERWLDSRGWVMALRPGNARAGILADPRPGGAG